MKASPPSTKTPAVGILILNYHQPEATLACVRRLLEVEGEGTSILWLENDAKKTLKAVLPVLEASGLPWIRIDSSCDYLPQVGQIGFVPIQENLGYAGGNNVGLRFLERHGVEFAWVMNNDTLLTKGSSSDLLCASALRPDVALWGMWVTSPDVTRHIGLRIQLKDFAVAHITDPAELETNPLSFVNGCAMFVRTKQALFVGGIPEEYFMYYEDQAFTWEFRNRGLKIAPIENVEVLHAHSLSTGHRSRFTEYYCRRNRWYFIEKYFPSLLKHQKAIFFTYQMQKLLFRLRFDRIHLEWQAYMDYKNNRLGLTQRDLSRSLKT